MYEVRFTPDAFDDLHSLRKFEERQILREIKQQLKHTPAVETRNRKRLRPNDLAEWEARIGDFRVFYDVDEGVKSVKIEAIGRKKGSRLVIRGEEYEL